MGEDVSVADDPVRPGLTTVFSFVDTDGDGAAGFLYEGDRANRRGRGP